MKYDIILAGVGGQGVLSVSAIIASSAMKEGLFVKQSEVHGMSQRGGAVLANLRLARCAHRQRPHPARRGRDDPEHGAAREPALPAVPRRPTARWSPRPTRSSTSPTTPNSRGCSHGCGRCPARRLVDGEQLARAAGSARATNMVMVGAASHRLPVQVETLEQFIESTFARQGREGRRDEPEGVPRGARGGSMTARRGAHRAGDRRGPRPHRQAGCLCRRRRGPPVGSAGPRPCGPARDRGPRTPAGARHPGAAARVRARSSAEAAAADTTALGGDRVVVKVISPIILHKSDVGGVKIVRAPTATRSWRPSRDMEARLGGQAIVGFTINQFVRYDATLGSELILGLRWTADFGAVVTLGAGGIYTEFLAQNLKPGREIAIFSPAVTTSAEIADAIGRLAVGRLATGRLRGQAPKIGVQAVVDARRPLHGARRRASPRTTSPSARSTRSWSPAGLVALDILVKLGAGASARRAVAAARQAEAPAGAQVRGHHRRLREAEPGPHHPEQPDPRGVRPRADLRRQARAAQTRGLPLRARHRRRCRSAWISSSWPFPRRRRRRPSPRSSRARRPRASSSSPAASRRSRGPRRSSAACARRWPRRARARGRAR